MLSRTEGGLGRLWQDLSRALVERLLRYPRLRGIVLIFLAGAVAFGVDQVWRGEGRYAPPESVSTAAPADTLFGPAPYMKTGKVVRVTDGDTFQFQDERGERSRVRLASIDAPEVGDQDRPGQPFGQDARKALAGLIEGRRVTLHCHEQDHYQRHICDVPLGGDSTANRRMVESGMAWANAEARGRFLRDQSMRALEQRARDAGLGLWQRKGAVAPWQWRYDCWRERRCG